MTKGKNVKDYLNRDKVRAEQKLESVEKRCERKVQKESHGPREQFLVLSVPVSE